MIAMLTAKVFQSGNSQAIRIPKEFKTDCKEFYIRKFGECFYLIPTDDPWRLVKESIGGVPDDFMEDREQPSLVDLPEREML